MDGFDLVEEIVVDLVGVVVLLDVVGFVIEVYGVWDVVEVDLVLVLEFEGEDEWCC